ACRRPEPRSCHRRGARPVGVATGDAAADVAVDRRDAARRPAAAERGSSHQGSRHAIRTGPAGDRPATVPGRAGTGSRRYVRIDAGTRHAECAAAVDSGRHPRDPARHHRARPRAALKEMAMRDETRMLLESMNRLFEDHCTKAVLDAAETGTFPTA